MHRLGLLDHAVSPGSVISPRAISALLLLLRMPNIPPRFHSLAIAQWISTLVFRVKGEG